MRHTKDFDPAKAQALLAYIRQGRFSGGGSGCGGRAADALSRLGAAWRVQRRPRAAALFCQGRAASDRAGPAALGVGRLQEGPQVLVESRPRQGDCRAGRLDHARATENESGSQRRSHRNVPRAVLVGHGGAHAISRGAGEAGEQLAAQSAACRRGEEETRLYVRVRRRRPQFGWSGFDPSLN